MKVAIIMGSDSDYQIMKKSAEVLKKFGVDFEVSVISAHRDLDRLTTYIKSAKDNGIEVIIAGAGKAAHLPGVIAAMTTMPVIGVPIKSSTFDGMDALLSIVQMPPGIPVATVAVDGSDNAALLAVSILAMKYEVLEEKLISYRETMKSQVLEKDKKIKEEAEQIWKS
ncbi:N5-carboxyaminoimidazole ribonucleotide mutase [Oxobacter pfennigii]|uniref:N5-carboxyaminoimidazole ribonucleotide mutase n=1 Tax=Oxobacter pfennigii TaxID=36849 RepID=A0A0P8WDV6_9CLOT|nr:5-(carboxyamino)imidazole ribonucleotide mutase [Oxobacter pfennigii]KPU45924.1 N5-carboxyaminoimidazole ribonucleotide mutase [Oxobacter pfennigii]